MANGWALGKFAGEFAPARRLTLGSSNLVYFCEPTLRTQLHMSVCGPKRSIGNDRYFVAFGAKADVTRTSLNGGYWPHSGTVRPVSLARRHVNG